MYIGVTAGFGAPIGQHQLQQMVDLGLQMVRQDVVPGALPALVDEFVGVPLRPLYLLSDAAHNEPLLDAALPRLGPDGFDIQVFNEPGLFFHGSHQDYVDGIRAVNRDARLRGFQGTILAGGVANLGKDNLRWFQTAAPVLPSTVVMDIHRYSYKRQSQTRPWPGFDSRQAELDEVRRIAEGRNIACTEFGYHTAEEQVFYVWKARLTDDQVRDFLRADLDLFRRNALYCACIYQWGDGPTDDWINRFGLRYADGTFKPAVHAIRA